jgi:hypothetical protein
MVAASEEVIALFDARTGQPGPRWAMPGARGVSWVEGGLMDRVRGEADAEMSWASKPRFSPGGDAVALQDRTGCLVFVDVAGRAVHPTGREAGRAWIEDLAWFADGNHVLLGMSDNTMAIWRARPLAGMARFAAIGG